MINSNNIDKSIDQIQLVSDEILVALAKDGSENAYVELCRRHKPVAFSIVNRILRNREDSEDALQETFLKAYLHIGSFNGRSKFSTWFTRIAINTALMLLRKKAAHPMFSLDAPTDNDRLIFQVLACPSPNPETQITQKQMSCLLSEAIERLPLTLRNVITLRQMDDISVRQTAVQVGISIPAAKSRLLRARAELSTKMQGFK